MGGKYQEPLTPFNCGKRDSTNVPPQALYLMNSDFVRARAAALAKRVLAEATAESRIAEAYQRSLNRAPDEDESRLVKEFLDAPIPEGVSAEKELEKRWQDVCQALLASAHDFRMVE